MPPVSDVYSHPDYAGFLAAIRAAPGDDLPRLVLADWLEDHDPDRAEFVRLGVHHPNLALTYNGATGLRAESVPPAYMRLAALIRRSGHTWMGPWYDSEMGGRNGWEYRRGFVDLVMTDAASWLAHGDAILAREPVTAVTLTTWPEVHVSSFGLMLDGDLATQILPWEKVRDHPGGQVAGALAARWAGVTFTLPPEVESAADLREPPHWPEVSGVPSRDRAAMEQTVRGSYEYGRRLALEREQRVMRALLAPPAMLVDDAGVTFGANYAAASAAIDAFAGPPVSAAEFSDVLQRFVDEAFSDLDQPPGNRLVDERPGE